MIKMDDVQLIHGDSLQALKSYDDNYFDWAIVDPPYGIDIANMNMGAGKGKRCSKIKNRNWEPKDWDKEIPAEGYFNELFRVSRNQIIWGGNYFSLPTSQYFCIWDKGSGMYGRSFAECEYAWISNGGTRILKVNPVQKHRIHPTQKPIELYELLLDRYTSEGDLILDTHLGSGSIAIACHYMKRKLIGYEIDAEYYENACKRFKQQTSQRAIW